VSSIKGWDQKNGQLPVLMMSMAMIPIRRNHGSIWQPNLVAVASQAFLDMNGLWHDMAPKRHNFRQSCQSQPSFKEPAKKTSFLCHPHAFFSTATPLNLDVCW